MKQDSSNQPWGSDKFFTTEEEWLQYQEDECKGAEHQDCHCQEPFNRRSDPVRAASKPASKKMTLTPLRDLLSEPRIEMDWIVDGLLSKGGFSVMAAKTKTGKSTLARQLAVCVARGEPFLSRPTEKGLVIYLALEERREDVRNHFEDMGADGEALDAIKICAEMPPPDAIKQVREMAITEKPALIIIDTLARVAKIKDTNDYAQTTAGLEPLLAIAREIKVHICLLHHTRKGEGKGTDIVLGSTGIVASVDTTIIIHRHDKYRSISSDQRGGERFEETVLEFDEDRKWTTLGDTREQTEIERAKEAILEFLSGHGEAEEREIDEGVEVKRTHRKKALRQLVKEGKVGKAGEGKRGKPYIYKVSGFVVPTIYREPEYQKSKNDLTPCNDSPVSGSQENAISVSGSQEKKEVQAVLEIFPGASVGPIAGGGA